MPGWEEVHDEAAQRHQTSEHITPSAMGPQCPERMDIPGGLGSFYLTPNFLMRALATLATATTVEALKECVWNDLAPKIRPVYHARTKKKRDKTPKIMLTDVYADYNFGSAIFEREDVLEVLNADGSLRDFNHPGIHPHAAIRPMPEWLRGLCGVFSAHFGVLFNHVIAIKYSGPSNYTPWHSDAVPPGTPFLILTLLRGEGAARNFKLARGHMEGRKGAEKFVPDEIVWEKMLEDASLLFVTSALNDVLKHMVEAGDQGERISLVFRRIDVSSLAKLRKIFFHPDKKTNSLKMPELARTRGVDDEDAEEGDDDDDNDEAEDVDEEDGAVGADETAPDDSPMPPSDPPAGRIAGAQRQSSRTVASRRAGAERALAEEDGWVDEAKRSARVRDGRTAFVVGNQHSCSQDGLITGAKQLGIQVTKKSIYDATLPPEGDTKVGVIVEYARDALGIEMLDVKVPGVLPNLIFRTKGGPAFALLQLTEGVFFVELRVSLKGMPDDKHVVVYNAAYTSPEKKFAHCRGVLIDNNADAPLKRIEPKDRGFVVKDGKEVPAAREVFDSLFPGADRVAVVGVWLMRPLAVAPVEIKVACRACSFDWLPQKAGLVALQCAKCGAFTDGDFTFHLPIPLFFSRKRAL